MGNVINGFKYKFNQDVMPPPNATLKFDPLLGFPEGRKEKVMIATEEELQSAQIPLDQRDFCAHKLLEYLACRRKEFPFYSNCHHAKHHYDECEYGEFIDRMKDYERERRLMEREKRLKTRGG